MGSELDTLTYRVPEVAKILGISRSMVYKMVADHELPVIHMSDRLIRVPRQALEDWVKANTEASWRDR